MFECIILLALTAPDSNRYKLAVALAEDYASAMSAYVVESIDDF